ncbi:MAG: alkyl hydroperoxide reductase subunit F [Myxococcota bacterium]
MIDNAMLGQLKEVFARLKNPVELVYDRSSHPKQSNLVEMLTQLAGTSERIDARESDGESGYPRFTVRYQGKANGIRFTGIPGGHEFTSLVLAVLNSDGKGKLPDEALLNRVRRLRGPIRLRTYISLSCENCPDVVQALNLMATVHGDFEHEMVDGEFVTEEIETLGVQGVPSVIHDGALVHSGKATFTDLLAKLEDRFGIDDSVAIEAQDLGEYDVAIIGGGPAGASTAIYTARKGMKTVIITDRFGGQLQDTKGIENMVSVVYTEGPELSNKLTGHMEAYDNIERLEQRRVVAVEPGAPLALILDSGETLRAKRLVIATGAQWRELKVDGEREYLGRGVAFCPHCDGPFYKGKDIAVIGGGNSGVEAAIDLAGIVKSVTVFEFMPNLKADSVLVDKMSTLPNVRVVTNAKTTKIVGDGGKVIGLEYEERDSGESRKEDLAGVFVQIGLVPNSQFLKGLVATNDYGEIIVDEKGRTNVPGIYACGDVTTTPYKQIIVALGEGAKTGLAVFEDTMVA